MVETPLELTEDDLLPSPADLARRGQQHRSMLALSALTVVLAFALQVVSGEYIALRFLPSYPLPHSCASRAFFHTDCPGCGLTRSFILLAEGRLAESYARHHLGPLLVLALLLQFPYRLAALRHPHRDILPKRWRSAISHALITLLIANWLLRHLVPSW